MARRIVLCAALFFVALASGVVFAVRIEYNPADIPPAPGNHACRSFRRGDDPPAISHFIGDALVVDCKFEQMLAVESLNHAESFARVSARISVPRAISSSDAYSSGRWLYPLRQGINNIPVGAIREMKSESW